MSKPLVAICGIFALFILAVACNGDGRSSESAPTWDDPLQPGITWNLKLLNGRPLVYGSSITLTDNLASGHDSCNNYGMASLSDDQPRFTVLSTALDGTEAEGIFSSRVGFTERLGCGERLEKQADDYHAALKEAERFRIKDNWLEISDGENQPTLVFSRQPPLPGRQPNLAGTQWSMMGNTTPVTLAFLDDELAAIAGECFDFIVRYRITGRLFKLYGLHWWDYHQACIEGDSSNSLWGAEHYSVVGEKDSEKLLIGTQLGKTLTLDALSTVAQDTGQGEWSLKNIVSLTSDDIGQHVVWGVVPGSTVTLIIQEGLASGSVGCNTYQAPLTIDGEAIDIGPITKSEKSCLHIENSTNVIRQESRYLDLLPQVAYGVTFGERLFLSTGTGIYLIFEAK